jgi:hypothetical protein
MWNILAVQEGNVEAVDWGKKKVVMCWLERITEGR